jgi:hypothetical protein
VITKDDYAALYEYERQYGYDEGNWGPRYMITGYDTFSHEHYMVALCDTQEEADLIVLERRETTKKQGWLADSTSVRPPHTYNGKRMKTVEELRGEAS